MEPVEINAGEWYLRALRCDSRVDDSPALTAHGVANPAAYVAESRQAWADESRYTWAVCEPTTGEMLGEVTVTPRGTAAELQAWHNTGHENALETACAAVRRYTEGALGLSISAEN